MTLYCVKFAHPWPMPSLRFLWPALEAQRPADRNRSEPRMWRHENPAAEPRFGSCGSFAARFSRPAGFSQNSQELFPWKFYCTDR